MWCSRRPGISQQSSPINVISILGCAHQTHLSLVHLLMQPHFWLISVYLNNAVACIYFRLDGLQSFSKKYKDLGVLLIYYPFFLDLKPGIGRNSGPTGPPRIPGTPGTLSWIFVGPAISVLDYPTHCKPSPRPSPSIGMLFLALWALFWCSINSTTTCCPSTFFAIGAPIFILSKI